MTKTVRKAAGDSCCVANTDSNPSQTRPAGWLRYGASLGGFLDRPDLEPIGGRRNGRSARRRSDPVHRVGERRWQRKTAWISRRTAAWAERRCHHVAILLADLDLARRLVASRRGHVYGEHLQGISWGESRFSGAIGMESRGSRDSVFQLLVGFGTETFNSGADVNSIRVVVGARSGFLTAHVSFMRCCCAVVPARRAFPCANPCGTIQTKCRSRRCRRSRIRRLPGMAPIRSCFAPSRASSRSIRQAVRSTSTRSTRCRTRAGSRIAWAKQPSPRRTWRAVRARSRSSIRALPMVLG